MLDNEKAAVRQAGIYLLRELAISDEKYRSLCGELLASFIRSRIADALEKTVSTGALQKKLAETPSAVDVVDAFKSLCRTGGAKEEINLSGVVLSTISLSHPAALADLDFSKAYLYLINLHRTRCDFSGTTLRGGIVHQTSFSDNSFFDTNFVNVDFEDVSFQSAQFWNCTFENCTFRNCNMSGVGFLGDDGEDKSPFEADVLKDCWAWKGSVPRLGKVEFSGAIYSLGAEGKERASYTKEWEARRLAGLNYENIRPSKKLKVIPS